jgi:hypothetical protein
MMEWLIFLCDLALAAFDLDFGTELEGWDDGAETKLGLLVGKDDDGRSRGEGCDSLYDEVVGKGNCEGPHQRKESVRAFRRADGEMEARIWARTP